MSGFQVDLFPLRFAELVLTSVFFLLDDFGHDSQLPVLINAIGSKGISFSRLPNNCQQGPNQVPVGTSNKAQKSFIKP